MNKQKHGHWNLSDLYNGIDSCSFITDKTNIASQINRFCRAYENNLNYIEPKNFVYAFEQYQSLYERIYKLYLYVYLLWCSDTSRPDYSVHLQEIQEKVNLWRGELLFFELEWQQMSDKRSKLVLSPDILQQGKNYLWLSYSRRIHRLNKESEKILNQQSLTSQHAWVKLYDETLFGLSYSVKGQTYTQSELLSWLYKPSREDRKHAHRSLTRSFKKSIKLIAYIFNTLLLSKKQVDELRGYDTWDTSRHQDNQISVEVVQSLLNVVYDAYPMVQDFYQFKKSLLGVSRFYDYDRYASCHLTGSYPSIPWTDAVEIVTQSYEVFSPKAGEIVRSFFHHQWIDFQVRKGKYDGAFSCATVPGVHPYILVNYTGTLRDVQTLAHELGHGIHQYLARSNGFFEMDTSLVIAEMASVFGEMLTFDRLLKQAKTKEQRLELYMAKLEDHIATVFRQVSLYDFEQSIHTYRRQKGELQIEDFCHLWNQSQKRMYGYSVVITPSYNYWWCYVSHFIHYPGYVYAYAFGQLLALSLYQQYLDRGQSFVEHYMEVLALGGSECPVTLLKRLGIDIQDANFWRQGLKIFENQYQEAKILAYDLGL